MREHERTKKAELKKEEKKKKDDQAKRKREATGARKCSSEVKRKQQCFKDRPKGSEAGPARKINLNICCTCDGSYDQDVVEGTGVNWLACACGRWLHKECVDDCIRDEEKDHICPYCLDNLALCMYTDNYIVEPYKPQFRHFSDHFTVFLLFVAIVMLSVEDVNYNFLLTLTYAALGLIELYTKFMYLF